MKTSKINYRTLLAKASVVILLFVAFVSCRGRMEGINRNLKNVTQEELEVDANGGKALLPAQETNIINNTTWRYQLQRNLNSDVFAGYMMTPTIFQAGQRQNPSYFIVDGYSNEAWNTPRIVLNTWLKMRNAGFDKKYPDLYAISLICKVLAASLAADNYGTLPYSQYGDAATVPFDKPSEMYAAFFKDLDTAIKSLTKFENENPTADQFRFAPVDKSNYGGDYAKWIKAANTLRLRLAMQISLVAPKTAQIQAEKAVSQQYGVLEKGDGSFVIGDPNTNAIWTISNSWKNTRLGAPMSTILGGYHDPRLAKIATPVAVDSAVAAGDIDKYKGIREGIDLIKSQYYVGFSGLARKQSAPFKLIDVAESYFLRAEGALRGWDMGTDKQGSSTAQGFYEDGIRVSFAEYGVGGASSYINDDTHHQLPYVDPYNHANNSAPLSHITVKWAGPPNGAGHKVEDLKKIIIQKWIAIYPESIVAWTEFRRTGYPKLYPVEHNTNPHIPDGEFIKRIPYTSIFTNASQAQVNTAVSKFYNGQNTANQHLWWDVPTGRKGWVNQ